MKIIHVVGARPNFIKASPLIKKMSILDVENLIIHTGQHYDHNMSQQFFNELNIPKPDYNLNVGSGSHAQQTANIMVGCDTLFEQIQPDLVIVYGDVNSCLAAALVAKKFHPKIKIAHIESGLRSFDMDMPEEINRKLTDSISDLLFVTCEDALVNLKNEGIDLDKCYFVGNTMIDSLVEFQEQFDLSSILSNLMLNEKEYALVTLHRPSNVDTKTELVEIMDAVVEASKLIKCVFPTHPRTSASLKLFDLFDKYNQVDSLHLLSPLGYIDFMCLQKNAKLIITDSGGIQEESSFFGVPCLTVRDNTERPVTISNGTNTLIGTKYDVLYERVKNIDYDVKFNIELWDGKSADRIVKILGHNYE